MKKSIRIGAGLGFYGDAWEPVRASIERGGVQFSGGSFDAVRERMVFANAYLGARPIVSAGAAAQV